MATSQNVVDYIFAYRQLDLVVELLLMVHGWVAIRNAGFEVVAGWVYTNNAWLDYKLYLQLSLTIMSIDLSSVALIRLALCATHLYVPISVFLTLLRDKWSQCLLFMPYSTNLQAIFIPNYFRRRISTFASTCTFDIITFIYYGWTGTIDCHCWLHWNIMYRVIVKVVISWGFFYV